MSLARLAEKFVFWTRTDTEEPRQSLTTPARPDASLPGTSADQRRLNQFIALAFSQTFPDAPTAAAGLTFPQFAHAYFRRQTGSQQWKKQPKRRHVGPQTCRHSLSIRSLCSCSCWPGHMSRREAMSPLILKHAPTGDNEDDYDMLADSKVVGRIFVSQAAPQDRQWMWTIAYGHHEDRTPTHGYEPTREAAMAAFAKSWKR
jgi:hypothetical protein